MKKLFTVVATMAMLMFVKDACAQTTQTAEADKAASAKARKELLMQTRLQMLNEELQLTEKQKVDFEPVYRKYRSELQRMATRDANIKRDGITNENALRVLSARLSNQINTASVKQRYLHIFVTVIEPLQIMKLYRIEERIAREARKVVKQNNEKK